MEDIWNDVLAGLRSGRSEGAPSPGGARLAGVSALLEDALADADRAGLLRASQALEGAFRMLLADAPAEVRAVVGDGGSPAVRAAFLLGQVAMAQEIAGHAYAVRADASFGAALRGDRQGPAAALLAKGDLPLSEIAPALGTTELQASKVLSEMIRDGAADFRLVGGRATYFLTPPAKAVLAQGR